MPASSASARTNFRRNTAGDYERRLPAVRGAARRGGRWAVGSGQWAVGSGQWAVGSGQWKRLLPTASRQPLTARREAPYCLPLLYARPRRRQLAMKRVDPGVGFDESLAPRCVPFREHLLGFDLLEGLAGVHGVFDP